MFHIGSCTYSSTYILSQSRRLLSSAFESRKKLVSTVEAQSRYLHSQVSSFCFCKFCFKHSSRGMSPLLATLDQADVDCKLYCWNAKIPTNSSLGEDHITHAWFIAVTLPAEIWSGWAWTAEFVRLKYCLLSVIATHASYTYIRLLEEVAWYSEVRVAVY